VKPRYLITSALLYANGPMHLGHLAGAYLPADVFARSMRMNGADLVYICGSDEYGVAITLSAEKEGRSPKEHVDIYHKMNKELFNQMDFQFDHYSRTSNPLHTETTLEFFEDLYEQGLIEERDCEQLYSPEENRFLADRYVVGTCPKCKYEKARGDECTRCGANFEATDLLSPRSSLTQTPLLLKKTTHWFYKFDALKERLGGWLESKDWKPSVKKFSANYVKDLKARAITRDLNWGIPVPLKNAQGKVFYVWFDAPIGYISATREWANIQGNKELWKDYWLNDTTRLIHFIGKDNIPFHAVFFPAMLMGQTRPFITPSEVPANEFLTLEGKQFSKSEGWTIDLETMIRRYGSCAIRYWALANAPESSDTEFTWRGFQAQINSDLVGKLGNFINRVLTFCHKWTEGQVPENITFEEVDSAFLIEMEKSSRAAFTKMEQFKMREACAQLMEMAQKSNAFFDHKKPWADAKDPEKNPRMLATLFACLEAIKILSLTTSPLMPKAAQTMWDLIGQKGEVNNCTLLEALSSPICAGQSLQKPKLLFNKIEDEMIENELKELKQNAKEPKPTPQSEPQEKLSAHIDFKTFQSIELKVGKILSASKVEKSEKLLLLEVDLAEGSSRTVVSGIAKHISPHELVGRCAIFAANLKPAKIMGIESRGMLLCADTPEGGLKISFIEGLEPGMRLL
jgi:methionyl-tRNA synthetase